MEPTKAQAALITALVLKGVDDEGFSMIARAIGSVEFGEDPAYDAACIAHAIDRSNGLPILRLEFESFWNDFSEQQVLCELAELDNHVHAIKAS